MDLSAFSLSVCRQLHRQARYPIVVVTPWSEGRSLQQCGAASERFLRLKRRCLHLVCVVGVAKEGHAGVIHAVAFASVAHKPLSFSTATNQARASTLIEATHIYFNVTIGEIHSSYLIVKAHTTLQSACDLASSNEVSPCFPFLSASQSLESGQKT